MYKNDIYGYSKGNDPIPTGQTQTTLSAYITNNYSTITNFMGQAILTYNVAPTLPIPTSAFNDIILTLLENEFGWCTIDDPQETNWFLNDLYFYIPQLILLLGLRGMISLENILRNPYQEWNYDASAQMLYENSEDKGLSESSQHADNNTQRDINTANSSGSQMLDSVQSNSSGTSNQTAGSVLEGVNTEDSKNLLTINAGAVGTQNLALVHDFPQQSTTGTDLPVGANGLPTLGGARVASAQQNLANQNAVTNTQETDYNNQHSVNTNTTDTSNISAQDQSEMNRMLNAEGQSEFHSLDSFHQFQNSLSRGANQVAGQRDMNRNLLDIRKKAGYTTTAIFAHQFQIVLQTLFESDPAFKWFVDKFSWIRGVV